MLARPQDKRLPARLLPGPCSYETLRKHAADLAGCIDLLVCDEGHRWGWVRPFSRGCWACWRVSVGWPRCWLPGHHSPSVGGGGELTSVSFALSSPCRLLRRLKSAQGNKTISALTSLNCQRRVLLTGTPIQNGRLRSSCCSSIAHTLPFSALHSSTVQLPRDVLLQLRCPDQPPSLSLSLAPLSHFGSDLEQT